MEISVSAAVLCVLLVLGTMLLLLSSQCTLVLCCVSCFIAIFLLCIWFTYEYIFCSIERRVPSPVLSSYPLTFEPPSLDFQAQWVCVCVCACVRVCVQSVCMCVYMCACVCVCMCSVCMVYVWSVLRVSHILQRVLQQIPKWIHTYELQVTMLGIYEYWSMKMNICNHMIIQPFCDLPLKRNSHSITEL